MTISLIRTIILYSIVILSIRIMGKRQIGEMQASEFVVTLMISNIATLPMQEMGIPIFYGIVPIFALVVIEVLLSYLMMKNEKIRHLISGKPVVIIENGDLKQKNLREMRFTIDDLLEELRKNGVFDISTVKYAIVETDGSLSVLLKPEEVPLTPKTAGIESEDEELAAAVIRDGKISDSSLRLSRHDKNWVIKILNIEKVKLKDVFIMTADVNGKYSIVRKEKQ